MLGPPCVHPCGPELPSPGLNSPPSQAPPGWKNESVSSASSRLTAPQARKNGCSAPAPSPISFPCSLRLPWKGQGPPTHQAPEKVWTTVRERRREKGVRWREGIAPHPQILGPGLSPSASLAAPIGQSDFPNPGVGSGDTGTFSQLS